MNKLKIVSWMLVIINIALILALTLQDAATTVQLSTETRDVVVQITNTPVEVARQSWWYVNIRKLGHIPEYLALGLTMTFAWYVTRGKVLYWRSLFLCALVSVSDQIIKGFLPTREFDATDLPFDFVGYVVGILIVTVVVKICERKKKSVNSKD